MVKKRERLLPEDRRICRSEEIGRFRGNRDRCVKTEVWKKKEEEASFVV